MLFTAVSCFQELYEYQDWFKTLKECEKEKIIAEMVIYLATEPIPDKVPELLVDDVSGKRVRKLRRPRKPRRKSFESKW